MADFEATIQIGCTQANLFEFLILPENALKVSPPTMGMSFLEAPDVFAHGTQFEFQVTGFGPPQTMRHEIIDFEPPRRFVEQQVTGPLKSWWHEHLIEATTDDSVVMVDRVRFEPPGGMLGFLVTEDRIRESLEQSFAHRHQELKKLLEAGTA